MRLAWCLRLKTANSLVLGKLVSWGLAASPTQSQVHARARGAHLSPRSWIPVRNWGRTTSFPEAGRAELRVPPEACRLRESLASLSRPPCPTPSLIPQVPSCGGPVTSVWAGGHV